MLTSCLGTSMVRCDYFPRMDGPEMVYMSPTNSRTNDIGSNIGLKYPMALSLKVRPRVAQKISQKREKTSLTIKSVPSLSCLFS
ncbi:UNVERIFIED_CONTAM: hypothetical protein K2H54_058182 [Gekko kuhli]